MSAAGMLQYLAASDLRICGRLAVWTPPRILHWWMLASSRLGDGWLWAATITALALIAGGDWRPLAAACLSAAAANLAVVVLKGRVRRPRPADPPANCFFAGVADRWTFDEFSFPSGHALNAFALATTVSLLHPALTALLLFLAVSIALSRLVLGVHFLTDVLAGSLIGVLAGAGAFAAVLN